ncbi:hypothetical protein LSAT2_027547 [Lamellibrachia satsuma]|nr:hypothetical protein LSAT2_027547 [Lamellibrachia satsuma]
MIVCISQSASIRVKAQSPVYARQAWSNNINECDSSPCRNNGTCEDARSSYNCICVQGYTGHNCETDIDECASSPCHNGARCSTSSQVDMYTCDCLAGNTGHNCEIDVDECASSPCHNGARCSNSQVDMFSCDCLTGYAGHSCEIDTNTCRSDPCLNGGTCRDWFNAFHCQCVDGFSGDVCEKQSKEGSSIFIIAGAAGGGVTIGVVIGIIVCMICRCRKQQSVQEDADGEMSGPRTQPSHTDEKMMSTTNFKGANVQDENSAADLAIQQRAITRSHYSDTGYEQPVATNPRHTYVNAVMIKREAPTDDYEEM